MPRARASRVALRSQMKLVTLPHSGHRFQSHADQPTPGIGWVSQDTLSAVCPHFGGDLESSSALAGSVTLHPDPKRQPKGRANLGATQSTRNCGFSEDSNSIGCPVHTVKEG